MNNIGHRPLKSCPPAYNACNAVKFVSAVSCYSNTILKESWSHTNWLTDDERCCAVVCQTPLSRPFSITFEIWRLEMNTLFRKLTDLLSLRFRNNPFRVP